MIMVWVLAWTPETDALLIYKRDEVHMRWEDIAVDLGKSRSGCHRRYGELQPVSAAPSIIPEPAPHRPTLHELLGIETHVHRQAVLNDPRMREWDSVTRVWSHNHLFRDSITLAGASA